MIHCFKSKLILLLLLPLPLFAAEPQDAKDLYELPKLVAVQNRQYYLNREFTSHVGYLPMDSFNKSIVLGASYTHYLSDFIGWEIANFNYCFNQDTGLKKQLLSSFNADTEGLLDYPDYYLTTNIIYTPLYNKSLLFNKTLVHGDLSFVFGGGLLKYHSQGNGGVVQGGVILRFFTKADQSLKFDVRTLIPMGLASARVNLSIIVGYSFELGSPPPGFKEYKEPNEFEL